MAAAWEAIVRSSVATSPNPVAFRVTAVKYVVHRAQLQAYQALRVQMRRRAAADGAGCRYPVNETVAFHGCGTDYNVALSISKSCLDKNRAGRKTGAVYGAGFYVTRTAAYALDYAVQQGSTAKGYLLVCSVLAGTQKLGRSSDYVAPERADGLRDEDSLPVPCDSVTDETGHMVVGFSDNLSYVHAILEITRV